MRRFPEKERNSRSRRLNRLILFAAEGHNKTETIYLKELVNDMDRFIASYNKSMEGIYHHLKDRLPTAISNARALEKRAIDRGYELHSCAGYEAYECSQCGFQCCP